MKRKIKQDLLQAPGNKIKGKKVPAQRSRSAKMALLTPSVFVNQKAVAPIEKLVRKTRIKLKAMESNAHPGCTGISFILNRKKNIR